VEEKGLACAIGGIVNKDKRSHFATGTVRCESRVAADFELKRLGYGIHHDFASFWRALGSLKEPTKNRERVGSAEGRLVSPLRNTVPPVFN
jgi:hypothetical protein